MVEEPTRPSHRINAIYQLKYICKDISIPVSVKADYFEVDFTII